MLQRNIFGQCSRFLRLQIVLGVITAHYAVEGQNLYGLPLADYLPYSVTRTWHTQLSVFWIATAWLATGWYVAPLISGHEPKFQRFGVNFLYVCLLLIVVGSFAGEWLGINQFFANLTMNFWFGHQGYEYVDLGRFWQIFLFIGMLLWLLLMFRALLPALREGKNRALIILLVLASVAIGSFVQRNLVGAGLLGFLINTPLALYYMQGLNTTAAHGHGALFGVYGMLGIGLMLFCLRGMKPQYKWNDRWMSWAFWSLNIGLAMMIIFALLPAGLWQAYNASIHGYWFVRSAEFIHSSFMEAMVWARVPGDIIFAVGAFALCWTVAGIYRANWPAK